jgi:hypothetical protein
MNERVPNLSASGRRQMNDPLFEAARVIRPFLAQLVGPAAADDLDHRISGLLDKARRGQDTSEELRALLESDENVWLFTAIVINDAPHFRPPQLQPRRLRCYTASEPRVRDIKTFPDAAEAAGSFDVRIDGGDRPDVMISTRGSDANSRSSGSEPVEPAIVSRFLQADFPTRVRTGDPLTLIALISEQWSNATPSSQLRSVAVGAEIMLTCSAPGFDLRSEMQVTVVVPASGDSDPVPFQLVPTDPGLRTITIRAFVGSSYLGALSVQVTVDSTGRTEQPARHSAGLSRRDWQEGEVTLEIDYDQDKKVYTYRWRDGTFVPDTSFRTNEQLLRTPVEVVDGLVQGLNGLARGRTGYSAESASGWLKNQGIGLWQSFFPDRLQAQFRENWDRITRLSIISRNDMIPWELLYASDQEGELGYLAERFPIARLPQSGIPSALRITSADFVRPAKDSPAAATTEVKAVGDILCGRGVDVRAAMTDLDSLLARLGVGDFGVLHFASHTSFATIPSQENLRSTRSAWVSPRSSQASCMSMRRRPNSAHRRRWYSSTPAAATGGRRSTRASEAGPTPS